jgi:hypothetical protein
VNLPTPEELALIGEPGEPLGDDIDINELLGKGDELDFEAEQETAVENIPDKSPEQVAPGPEVRKYSKTPVSSGRIKRPVTTPYVPDVPKAPEEVPEVPLVRQTASSSPVSYNL